MSRMMPGLVIANTGECINSVDKNNNIMLAAIFKSKKTNIDNENVNQNYNTKMTTSMQLSEDYDLIDIKETTTLFTADKKNFIFQKVKLFFLHLFILNKFFLAKFNKYNKYNF